MFSPRASPTTSPWPQDASPLSTARLNKAVIEGGDITVAAPSSTESALDIHQLRAVSMQLPPSPAHQWENPSPFSLSQHPAAAELPPRSSSVCLGSSATKQQQPLPLEHCAPGQQRGPGLEQTHQGGMHLPPSLSPQLRLARAQRHQRREQRREQRRVQELARQILEEGAGKKKGGPSSAPTIPLLSQVGSWPSSQPFPCTSRHPAGMSSAPSSLSSNSLAAVDGSQEPEALQQLKLALIKSTQAQAMRRQRKDSSQVLLVDQQQCRPKLPKSTGRHSFVLGRKHPEPASCGPDVLASARAPLRRSASLPAASTRQQAEGPGEEEGPGCLPLGGVDDLPAKFSPQGMLTIPLKVPEPLEDKLPRSYHLKSLRSVRFGKVQVHDAVADLESMKGHGIVSHDAGRTPHRRRGVTWSLLKLGTRRAENNAQRNGTKLFHKQQAAVPCTPLAEPHNSSAPSKAPGTQHMRVSRRRLSLDVRAPWSRRLSSTGRGSQDHQARENTSHPAGHKMSAQSLSLLSKARKSVSLWRSTARSKNEGSAGGSVLPVQMGNSHRCMTPRRQDETCQKYAEEDWLAALRH